MKIKKGDEIVMLVGKDKGKKGKIVKTNKKDGRVAIDGLNLVKKHRRPTRQGEKGEVIMMPRMVDISNVSLFCKNCGKGVKVGFEISGDKKSRICRKCKQII